MIWSKLNHTVLAIGILLPASAPPKADYFVPKPSQYVQVLEQGYQAAWNLYLRLELKQWGCTPPPSTLPLLDDKTVAKNRQAQHAFHNNVVTYIDNYYLRIDPALLANGARLQVTFPTEEQEIMGPTIRGCIFSFEYPQIAGLADKAVQARLNETLKDEILRNDRWPRLPGNLSCEDPFLETISEEKKRFSISSSARMRCHVEFARGSLVSINCIGAVTPGANPAMFYYPVTFDLRSGKLLSLHELFMTKSNYVKRLAEARLESWLDARSSSETEDLDTLESETLERQTSRFRSSYYDYYLSSECQSERDSEDFIGNYRKICLSFQYDRHSAILYDSNFGLGSFQDVFKSGGLLENAMQF